MCEEPILGPSSTCFAVHKAPDDILYIHGECFVCQFTENGEEDAGVPSGECEEGLGEGMTVEDEEGEQVQEAAVFLDLKGLPTCTSHVCQHSASFPVFDPATQSDEAREFFQENSFCVVKTGVTTEDYKRKTDHIFEIIATMQGYHGHVEKLGVDSSGWDTGYTWPGKNRHELGLVCDAVSIEGEPQAVNDLLGDSYRAEPIQDQDAWDTRLKVALPSLISL